MKHDVENIITAAIWLNAVANENRDDGFEKPPVVELPPILPSTLNYLQTLRGADKLTIASDSPWFKYMVLLQPDDIHYYDLVEISYTAGYNAEVSVTFKVAAMTNCIASNSYPIPPLNDPYLFINFVTLVDPVLNDGSYIAASLKAVPPYIELQTGDVVFYANNRRFNDDQGVVADDGFIVNSDSGVTAIVEGLYWVSPIIKNPSTGTEIALTYAVALGEAQPDPMPLILSE